MTLAVIGRVTLELEGERVVVAPFSIADMRAAQTADEIGALELFAGHIEEPADAGERGAAWVAAACEVWRAAVGGPCLAGTHPDIRAIVSDDAVEAHVPVWPRQDISRLARELLDLAERL